MHRLNPNGYTGLRYTRRRVHAAAGSAAARLRVAKTPGAVACRVEGYSVLHRHPPHRDTDRRAAPPCWGGSKGVLLRPNVPATLPIERPGRSVFAVTSMGETTAEGSVTANERIH